MASYPYKALHSFQRQVRLLTLHRASEESDDLTGSISYHSLNDGPTYDAVSYTWNYDLVGAPIHIDGVAFKIGPNLESALRHIRQPYCDRTLWIDAICINQKDEEERKQQVRLMQWIFRLASTVIAWLGKATYDSGLALSTLEQLEEGDVIQMAQDSFTCPRWLALKHLWSRPFWGRIWIVQEFALGNGRVQIQCGHDRISRPALERAFRTLKSHLDNPSTLLWEGLHCNMDWFMNLFIVCCGYDSTFSDPQDGQNLEDLLDFTGHFLATDRHDHVYALLGLLKDRGTTIEPDYSMTLKQMYANTVKQLMKSKGTLKVLNGNRSGRVPNLSSWMPTYGDHVRRGYGWRSGFTASGRDTESSAVVSGCCNFLVTEGVLVDHIDDVQGPFKNEQSTFQDPKILAHMETMTRQAFSKHGARNLLPTTDSIRTAFLKALTSNWSESANTSGEDCTLLNLEHQLNGLMRPIDSSMSHEETMKWHGPLIQAIVTTLRYRCFFTTIHGFIGIGPYQTKPHDYCVVLPGGNLPFVLRDEDEHQILVGDCYVHGIMHGELMGLVGSRRSPSGFCFKRDFVIH